ncbi:MAG: cell division/cell wall cluster transcriptional repressor MraZ [Desulfuromonas sp.]|nr:MAG: cell division/cell wall cluster transcriptional repressor MraZ [Desulfuromonas sp.]
MSFAGENHNSIDPKGRLSIPARFREVLMECHGDELLVLAKNTEGGLTAYPPSIWKGIVAKVKSMPNGAAKTATLRLVTSPAQECGFDKQGRVLVPSALRDYAGLGKNDNPTVVVVGMEEKIEIYNEELYAQVTGNSGDVLRGNPDLIAELGL